MRNEQTCIFERFFLLKVKTRKQFILYVLLKTWEKRKLYLVSERHDKIVIKNLRTSILVHTFVQVDVHLYIRTYPLYLHANTVYQKSM
jgi:hypothetical protein